MTDPDEPIVTSERVEQFEKGFQLRIESKRGSSTNDRDTVRATANVETMEDVDECRDKLIRHTVESLEELREFQPDEDE